MTTASGRTREVPAHVDTDTIVGLDPEGRIAVREDWMSSAFGLTLCCDAWDKGVEDGVVCRACYGGDRGAYLFDDEVDPISHLST